MCSILQNALPLGKPTNTRTHDNKQLFPVSNNWILNSYVLYLPACIESLGSNPITPSSSPSCGGYRQRRGSCIQEDDCLPLSGIPYNVLPWVCWAIWTSTNTLVFENQIISPEETTTKSLRLSKEWSQARGEALVLERLPLHMREPSRSEPSLAPDSSWVTCMTDAAWNKDRHMRDWPGISLDHHWDLRFKSLGFKLRRITCIIAEVLALRPALSMALSLSFQTSRSSPTTKCSSELSPTTTSQKKSLVSSKIFDWSPLSSPLSLSLTSPDP